MTLARNDALSHPLPTHLSARSGAQTTLHALLAGVRIPDGVFLQPSGGPLGEFV